MSPSCSLDPVSHSAERLEELLLLFSHRPLPGEFCPITGAESFRSPWGAVVELRWLDLLLCFSSASDVGSGGAGGNGVSGDGDSGGRGGGGGGGDGGDGGTGGKGGDESNRSLILCCLGLLAKYPVRTKAITSAFLSFIGDLICQLVFDQVPSLDLKRIFSFTFVGLVLATLHFWYLYLSKLVTVTGAPRALMRLLLGSEGRPSQVVPRRQQELFSAILANWQLWIPFQFLNFRFVPHQFQVLAANVLALA